MRNAKQKKPINEPSWISTHSLCEMKKSTASASKRGAKFQPTVFSFHWAGGGIIEFRWWRLHDKISMTYLLRFRRRPEAVNGHLGKWG